MLFSLSACHLAAPCAGLRIFCAIKISVGSYGHSSSSNTYLGQGVLWQLHLCKWAPPIRNIIMWSSSWCQLQEKKESYHQVFLNIFFIIRKNIRQKLLREIPQCGGNGLKLQGCYSWGINIDPTGSGWKRKQEESHSHQREIKARISRGNLWKVKSWLQLGHYVTCWYHSSPVPYQKTLCSLLSAELPCRLVGQISRLADMRLDFYCCFQLWFLCGPGQAIRGICYEIS